MAVNKSCILAVVAVACAIALSVGLSVSLTRSSRASSVATSGAGANETLADITGNGRGGGATQGGSTLDSSTTSPGPTVSTSDEATPSVEASADPTYVPSNAPSNTPSYAPSASPSKSPTAFPTNAPTPSPSRAPSASPSASPSVASSNAPTISPTRAPSASPSTSPSIAPSNDPTFAIEDAGGSQPFYRHPPASTLNCIIALEGIYPSRSRRNLRSLRKSGPDSNHRKLAGTSQFLGEISWGAFNYAPRGWASCDGQLLPISQHQSLFSLLGTTYGGDGRTTFALPDARGRSVLHTGDDDRLSDRRLGFRGGSESASMTLASLPSHSHVNTESNVPLETTGGSQPLSIMPPFVTLRCIISLQGIYPSRNRRGLEMATNKTHDPGAHRRLGVDPFVGEISWVPYSFAPRGWADCDGRLLSISENSALFSLLGTFYGGDGRTTFGLPDARGRMIVHAGSGQGLSERRVGTRGGVERTTLAISDIPSHYHSTFATNAGGSRPFSVMSPYLTMNCVIALNGMYPSRSRRSLAGSQRSLHGGEPFIGDVMWVPYNFAPRGWAFCDGQLLSISQHSALFSLLGTQFGGDGRATFGLPDLRGRSMVHVGTGPGLSPRRMGESFGSETHTVTWAEMAEHSHLH